MTQVKPPYKDYLNLLAEKCSEKDKWQETRLVMVHEKDLPKRASICRVSREGWMVTGFVELSNPTVAEKEEAASKSTLHTNGKGKWA